MIVTIGNHMKDIVTYLNTVSAITSLVPWWIYFEDPMDIEWITGNFIYINIVSDTKRNATSNGYLTKRARISFHIIGASQTVTPHELYNIENAITNAIVDEKCRKIDIPWITMVWIEESGYTSPVLEVEQRPYIVKDYLFNYFAI